MSTSDMALSLDIPKRHSDPAPCIEKVKKDPASRCQETPGPARSAPDLRFLGSANSPSLSRCPVTPSKSSPVTTSSPARKTTTRKSRAFKYRRLSSTGYSSSSGLGYFNTTPRRATHPNTSPRKLRRFSLWLEDEPDPWTQYRNKGLSSTVPNGDDKPFMAVFGDNDAGSSSNGCYYRLRSFSVTSKGIVNLGDFVRPRSHSDTSVSSEESCRLAFENHHFSQGRDRKCSVESTTSSSSATAGSLDAPVAPSKYRVLLLGAEEVGKTSLVAQFTTSECLTTFNSDVHASIDGSEERTISLIVDGEESELVCEDPIDSTYKVDDSIYCSTEAFLVVYSVTDRRSFHQATVILDLLRDMKNRYQYLYTNVIESVVILVANKVDLVRCRVVSLEEGRCVADRYEVKYIETSVGFNHNVDELLVGIVTQLRLKKDLKQQEQNLQEHQQQHQRSSFSLSPRKSLVAKSVLFSLKARGFMDRLLQKCDLKTRSCDNLHVL